MKDARPRSIWAIRALAGAAFLSVVLYWLLRVGATRCSGAACDSVYLPLSLLVPILSLVLVAATGLVAIAAVRPRQRYWLAVLIVATTLGVGGPIAAAFVLRESPDLLVLLASLFMVASVISAVAYTLVAGQEGCRMGLS
jgi:hypothetical protein